MDSDVLSIQERVNFDESIAHYETHAHQPYASSTFNNSDEIRIAIQHQDACLLPSRSSIRVQGKLMATPAANAAKTTKFINNGICHLFEEIRYELNGIEIDRNKNVGFTSHMKGIVSLSPNQVNVMHNAGWYRLGEIVDDEGNFDVCIPLSMVLGFAEDYRKMIVNAKHELILVRSRNDINAIMQTAAEDFRVMLNKIEWLMPYITPSDHYKIKMLNFIGKDPPISMSFRSWEMYEYPLLPNTSKNIWAVKTSSQLEKPRFVILGFQTNRKNDVKKDASLFDHCNLSNVKLFLNSQHYPYGNLNLDIENNQFAQLYDMFANFQPSYYADKQTAEPWLSKIDFLTHAPLVVIDCSKQNESIKFAPVDIRLEFETKNNIPNNTSAYCLIIHDRIVQYHPISGGVKKLV